MRQRASHEHTVRRQAGITLIEVLAGALIVGLVLSAATWSVSQAGTSSVALAESPTSAALLAREIYELALTLDTQAGAGVTATSAGTVAGLGSLDGAVFMPPITSALETLSEQPRWRQTVSVSVWNLADLSVPANAAYAAAASTSGQLYRLSVTVTNNGLEQGTWWWWLNP